MKPRGPDSDALVRVLAQAARTIGRRPEGGAAGPEVAEIGAGAHPDTVATDGAPVVAEELDHAP